MIGDNTMGLSQREQVLLGTLSLVVVGVVGGLFVIVPQVQAVQKAFEANKQAQQQVKDAVYAETRMQQNIEDYKVKLASLKHLNVRPYEPGRLEASVKSFMDEVVALAANKGTQIISLSPYQAAPAVKGSSSNLNQGELKSARQRRKEEEAAKKAEAAAEAAKTEEDERKTAIEQQVDANPLPLSTYGLSLQVRGSYSQIVSLLTGLASFATILEVESMNLANEAGPTREGASVKNEGSHLDPARPIVMSLKVRLFLMEQGMVDSLNNIGSAQA
jgi:hypothetical protein